MHDPSLRCGGLPSARFVIPWNAQETDARHRMSMPGETVGQTVLPLVQRQQMDEAKSVRFANRLERT